MSRLGKKNTYDGKAGQLAVMSELLCRGWNVAMPEIDVGDDVFAVMDSEREFVPIQVKTANANQQKKSYSATFEIPLAQLIQIKSQRLIYTLAIRLDSSWKSFIIIDQYILFGYYNDPDKKFGNVQKNNLHLYIS